MGFRKVSFKSILHCIKIHWNGYSENRLCQYDRYIYGWCCCSLLTCVDYLIPSGIHKKMMFSLILWQTLKTLNGRIWNEICWHAISWLDASGSPPSTHTHVSAIHHASSLNSYSTFNFCLFCCCWLGWGLWWFVRPCSPWWCPMIWLFLLT